MASRPWPAGRRSRDPILVSGRRHSRRLPDRSAALAPGRAWGSAPRPSCSGELSVVSSRSATQPSRHHRAVMVAARPTRGHQGAARSTSGRDPRAFSRRSSCKAKTSPERASAATIETKAIVMKRSGFTPAVRVCPCREPGSWLVSAGWYDEHRTTRPRRSRARGGHRGAPPVLRRRRQLPSSPASRRSRRRLLSPSPLLSGMCAASVAARRAADHRRPTPFASPVLPKGGGGRWRRQRREIRSRPDSGREEASRP